jgi:hypothetical protein
MPMTGLAMIVEGLRMRRQRLQEQHNKHTTEMPSSGYESVSPAHHQNTATEYKIIDDPKEKREAWRRTLRSRGGESSTTTT